MNHPDPTHPDDCFGCKLHSIQWGNVEELMETRIQKQQERDLPAYKRLRANGLQPRATKGAAELEGRAHDQLEIELGKLIHPKLLKDHRGQIQDGMAIARDSEYTISDIKEWKDKAKAQ